MLFQNSLIHSKVNMDGKIRKQTLYTAVVTAATSSLKILYIYK